MIYTAEEILNKHHYTRQDPECDMEGLIKIINEARIEAIKECAEIAKSEWKQYDGYMGPIVDKYSILKLLDQIK